MSKRFKKLARTS